MRGFSLVELSIVLVILGLLAGGVLAGKSLIAAAELRKQAAAITNLRTATHTFRDKYIGLPGDLTNATAFWGAANTSGAGGQCSAPLTNTGTGTQTCNGNGNRQLDAAERYRFFQHLGNAGLLEGDYTGLPGNAPPSGSNMHDVAGENIMPLPGYPTGGVTGVSGGIIVGFISQTSLDTYFSFNLRENNYLRIAACCHVISGMLDAPFMRGPDAWNLDMKIDDGMPYYGQFQVMKGYWNVCTTARAVDATYILNGTNNRCSLLAPL